MIASALNVVKVYVRERVLIKRIGLLVMIFILALSTPALATESDNGIIEGVLINGTSDGSSVGGQEVTLNTSLNDVETATVTATADEDGNFVFGGLSTGVKYTYQVVINFQDADYSSDWLGFDEGETTRYVEVTVYDSTTSDEAIYVEMAHTVINVGEGELGVREVIFFVNEGDRTYIGADEVGADGKRETLRFSLPEGASGLQLGGALMECCVKDSNGGFVDTMSVLPGTSAAAYSYEVNHDSGTYSFLQNMFYPTISYSLLVEGKGVEVASVKLTEAEPMQMENTTFQHFVGAELAPGETIAAQISGLPLAIGGGSSGNQTTLIWIAVIVVVLAAGFIYFFQMRRDRLQPATAEGSPAATGEDSPDRNQERLLIELAKLDDDFEDGTIEEDVYRKLRDERKSQLVVLLQRPKKSSGK